MYEAEDRQDEGVNRTTEAKGYAMWNEEYVDDVNGGMGMM